MLADNILVVDDDLSSTQAIASHLQKLGIKNVLTASNVAEAKTITKQHKPDLIILDIKLGEEIDGIELANQIKSRQKVPIIFITAYADDEVLDRAKNSDPYGFINKPVRESDIKSTVMMALSKFESDHQYQDQQANNNDFKITLHFNLDGEFLSVVNAPTEFTEAKKLADIQNYLSQEHNKLLNQCVKNHEPLYLVSKKRRQIFSWEYKLIQEGTIVEVIISDITQHHNYIDQSIRNSVLTEALDRLVTGIIITNSNLKVYYCNRAAEKIIKNNKIIKISDGYINTKDRELNAKLRQNILEDSDDTFLISKTLLTKPIQLLITPLANLTGNINKDLPAATIYLFESIEQPERIEDVIRAMYNLSRTEARIVAHLVWNPHIEEVADTLDISYNTVRTHLKRIYVKTNTKNLSSLIHMIVTGPAGLLLHSTD